MSEDRKILNVPYVQSVRYKQNFINTAVCELRFPTLLELERAPPAKLQSRLRKKYPFYEVQKIIDMDGANLTPPRCRYLFRSKGKDWTVSMHSASLSLETTKYTDFSDFFSRFSELLDKSKDVIDSDFFTRVGLRYINRIPLGKDNLSEWLNSELEAMISDDTYGDLEQYLCGIRGYTDTGSYNFRHGFSSSREEYTLDFDYYKENIEYEEVKSLLRGFNRLNFSFFSWCLGSKAKDYLGKGVLKKSQGL